MSVPLTRPFDRIGIADIPQVGGKNASLGEMVQALAREGVRVPDGFATTADGYRSFLKQNNLDTPIRAALDRYKHGEIALHEVGDQIRRLILDSEFSANLSDEIANAYEELGKKIGKIDPAVAVRSSATAEDLPDASFAGQQETFLNVRGKRALLDACRRCYASLFTDRAISYRDAKGFDHLAVALSIGVQQMVRSDKAGSGVMFTIDTETGFPNVVVVSAAWGLGETVVQGSVDPDKYVVFKPLLELKDSCPIIEKSLGKKAIKLVYAEGGSKRTRLIETSSVDRKRFVLPDRDILELSCWAVAVEKHYGRPMDLEWAKDGDTGELFLVQARPETVQSGRQKAGFTLFKLTGQGQKLVSGAAVGTAIASGDACIIKSTADIAEFRNGSILVTERTDPDWMPVMKRASGIVTEHGGTTSHAAIVSRELGLPAVVGAADATNILKDGQTVTLSCAEGDIGIIYDGKIAFTREEVDLGKIPETRTQVMVNLANPAAAFQWWRLPAKGVGLARMEFIINALIKAHPMALLHPEKLDDKDRHALEKLTEGYADPAEYFVDTLTRGIARLATPYYPHPAIVRLSDFKTNEYSHLVGGSVFEPAEENPMLGFRGASRYYDERYREGFALECRALKRVREEMGFTNVIIMVPFCRTPAEADRVLKVMAENGLRRGEADLQIYMMCEIPSNVILAEQFATRFDGFSIGSNDLTQLVLGVDRDSGQLAHLFDERDEAVMRMIAEVIGKAKTSGIKIGICGQAPSNYPEFAAFVVERGIDSISLNPDSFAKTIAAIAEAERTLEKR